MVSVPGSPAAVGATEEAEPWAFAEGEEIEPGLHAWARLGDGRRCETWLAWSVAHWSPVTAKLPKPAFLGHPRAVASLRREADRLDGLAHPGLQRPLARRLDAARPHLLFEYVEGPTLGDLVDDAGPLSPIDTVLVGMQIAGALHYLHGCGLAHLDLKPGNVVLREGRPVVIDLELCRELGRPAPYGRARGTVDYMAPEQCRREPTAASMDLFALGVVLYEVVTGEPAYEAGRAEDGHVRPAQLAGHGRPAQLAARRPRAREVHSGVPVELDVLLWRLLDPDPTRRPPTAAALLGALAALLPPGDEGVWPGWATALLPPRG